MKISNPTIISIILKDLYKFEFVNVRLCKRGNLNMRKQLAPLLCRMKGTRSFEVFSPTAADNMLLKLCKYSLYWGALLASNFGCCCINCVQFIVYLYVALCAVLLGHGM
jgi:hypothetical protein